MDFAEIIFEKKDRVATVTMNRPEKMNAWTPKMGAEMRTAMLDAERDPSIGAIIVTGAMGWPRAPLAAPGRPLIATLSGQAGAPQVDVARNCRTARW